MTPDIKSLTCNVFSSQTDSFTGNSQQWVTYTWCLEMDDCAHQTCLIPCLSPHFPLSSVAPVSREVVKVPVAASCVRGGSKAAMCAPPSGHHYYYGHQCLGSVQPGETMLTCWALREGSLYIYTLFLSVLHFIAAMPNFKARCPAVACQSNGFVFLSPCSASSRHVWQNVPVIMMTYLSQIIPAGKD